MDWQAVRVFLDSSVLISASISNTGASRAIITLVELGLVVPVICSLVLEEVTRNLQNKAPNALPYFEQLQAVQAWEIVADPSAEQFLASAKIIKPKDALILAAAINAQPACLITLDIRDFKQTQVEQQVDFAILTPGEFMQAVRQHLLTTFP